MPTTILVLGHIEKSKQNLDNFKQTQAKPKKQQTFERMFGFDSKDVFLLVPSFFGFEMEKPKNYIFFLNGYDQLRCKKLKSFFVFSTF
jgi:hypothetical protein